MLGVSGFSPAQDTFRESLKLFPSPAQVYSRAKRANLPAKDLGVEAKDFSPDAKDLSGEVTDFPRRKKSFLRIVEVCRPPASHRLQHRERDLDRLHLGECQVDGAALFPYGE